MKEHPPIELDEITIEELMQFSKEELDKIPFDKVRWQCKIKLCKHYSRMRNYGMWPWFYWRGKWTNVNSNFLMCGKHWKRYKGRAIEDIPLKKEENGRIVHGWDETGKETIIY